MSNPTTTPSTAPKTDDHGTIQPELSLARPGVVSYVWNLGYGDILIEVFEDGRVCVNQKEVEIGVRAQ